MRDGSEGPIPDDGPPIRAREGRAPAEQSMRPEHVRRKFSGPRTDPLQPLVRPETWDRPRIAPLHFFDELDGIA